MLICIPKWSHLIPKIKLSPIKVNWRKLWDVSTTPLWICASECTSPPLGEFVFFYLCLSGFFFFVEANTHFITLTLIKNTWPYSEGHSVHKSPRRWVCRWPSKALRTFLLYYEHPGLYSLNCGAALGSVTAARRAVGAHPSVTALRHGSPPLAHHAIKFKAMLSVMIILRETCLRSSSFLGRLLPPPLFVPSTLLVCVFLQSLSASLVSFSSSVKWEINLS